MRRHEKVLTPLLFFNVFTVSCVVELKRDTGTSNSNCPREASTFWEPSFLGDERTRKRVLVEGQSSRAAVSQSASGG